MRGQEREAAAKMNTITGHKFSDLDATIVKQVESPKERGGTSCNVDLSADTLLPNSRQS